MNTANRRDLLNLVFLVASTLALCTLAFGQTSTEKKFLFCFSQKGCSQCATMKPVWEKLRKSYRVIVVDLDNDPMGAFKSFKVEQTPTTVYATTLLDKSKEHWRFVGVKTEKEIEKMVADDAAGGK